MNQTGSLCNVPNTKMFLGDLADRTSFTTPQMNRIGPPRTAAKAGFHTPVYESVTHRELQRLFAPHRRSLSKSS